MEYEITVDNRDGTVWNLSELVSEVTWQTVRTGRPGKINLTLIRNPAYQSTRFSVNCGDVVRIKRDGVIFCYGYIFIVEGDQNREIRVVAYDQLRYLAETDTYIKANVKASEVIRDNALEVGLQVGKLADTGFVIPKFAQINQKRLDIIYSALDQTMLAKGTLFVFYDDGGELTLRKISDMKVDLILGDGSLVYEYTTNRNIDTDTYNRVKFVQEDNKAGKQHAYVYERSDTMARWGRLQYHQKVDSGLNPAQIEEIAKRFLDLRNREQRKFTVEALGYPGVRAGTVLQVTIKDEDINLNYLVDECTHKLNGGEHTMSLVLREYDYRD